MYGVERFDESDYIFLDRGGAQRGPSAELPLLTCGLFFGRRVRQIVVRCTEKHIFLIFDADYLLICVVFLIYDSDYQIVM